MKKRIYAAAVMLLAIAAPFAMLVACDDDDDDATEETDGSNSDSSGSDTSSNASTGGNTTAGTAVNLGLSVKWASKNIGATLPADYGDAYAWGATVSECDYACDCYTDLDAVSDIDDISGNSSYDAATANWGSKWRMPTYIEMQELIDDCTWTYTTQENSLGADVEGYLVTASNGNSVFLPVGDYDISSWGNYWSSSSDWTYYCDLMGDCSTTNFGGYAPRLSFSSSKYSIQCAISRKSAFMIRPVAD